MKIGNLVVYALCACLLLTGCGDAEKSGDIPSLGFTVNETRIVMNALARPVLDALGEPVSYTETASCAFDGLDKTYYFGSFYLSTYPMEGEEYVYSVWFADDSVSTEEGIRIGSRQSEVEAVYGTEGFSAPDVCLLTEGNIKLTILLTDGVVTSVQYEAIPA